MIVVISLATISALGALVVLGFLIRNLMRRAAAIATAKFPSNMRSLYNRSHAMCLFCIVPWGLAVFEAGDFTLWKGLMLFPILPMVMLSLWGKRL